MPELFIRVQTDGTITPKEAMISVCKNLVSLYGQFGRVFTREVELRKMLAQGDQSNQANGPSN